MAHQHEAGQVIAFPTFIAPNDVVPHTSMDFYPGFHLDYEPSLSKQFLLALVQDMVWKIFTYYKALIELTQTPSFWCIYLASKQICEQLFILCALKIYLNEPLHTNFSSFSPVIPPCKHGFLNVDNALSRTYGEGCIYSKEPLLYGFIMNQMQVKA